MRLLFDASILGYSELRAQYRTGIFQVALALLNALSRQPGVSVAVYSSSGNISLCKRALRKHGLDSVPVVGSRLWAELSFAALVARNLLFRQGARSPAGFFSWLLGKLESVRGAVDKAELGSWDAYLSPMDAVPESVRAVSSLRVAVVIHDLIPLRLKAYEQSRSDPTRWFPKMLRSLKTSDVLFTVSEFTRTDFLSDHPQFSAGRVVVAPNAAHSRFQPGEGCDLSAWGVPGRPAFFLAVSTLEPRKRIDTVVLAYQMYRAGGGRALLVVCGPDREHHREQILKPLLPANRASVVFTGYVEDAQLPRLYRECTAFLSLSEYEGFGLPILEAMSCGAPVVVSDRTSHPEVAGPAGLYADPDDAETVAGFLTRLTLDSGFRALQRQESLKQAARFSWDRTAAIVRANLALP